MNVHQPSERYSSSFLIESGINYVDDYAPPIVAELRANMVRMDADFSATPFKAKIANAV